MNTELNTTLRWLTECARWAMKFPEDFGERCVDVSLEVFE